MNPLTDIPDLLRQLRDDTATLMREEFVLVKTEMSEKLSRAARNLAYLAVGAMVGLTALLLLLMAVSYLLAEFIARQGFEPGTAAFIGFLIVAAIAGVVAAIMVSKALHTLAGNSLKPQKTVQSLHENKQWAQHKMS